MDTLFALEQGITNPRDGSVNWSHYDNYETVADAKKEVRNHKGKWRIVQMKVVWQNDSLPGGKLP
jgi:hypothetical protein